MAWPGTISNQITGTLITATLWNELVDGINFVGNLHDHTSDPGDGGQMVIDTTNGDIVVSNTTTETTIYTTSIPANTLSTVNVLMLALVFTVSNVNSGDTYTLRLKYGATTLITIAGFTARNDGVAQGFLNLMLWADESANAQEAQIMVDYGRVVTEDESGYGEGTSAEDSTGVLALTLTIEWAVANVLNIYTSKAAVLTGPFRG